MFPADKKTGIAYKPLLLQWGGMVLGAAILSFGMYNVHTQNQITEGGVLGLTLLLQHWTGLSASVFSVVLDALCYLLGLRFLGKSFLGKAVFSTIVYALFFRLWEGFGFLLPAMDRLPLLAAVVGAVFVGIGAGLIVRMGGAAGGDDALALVIQKLVHCKLSRAYFFTDLVVLLLSLTYIPLKKIAFSLISVLISSLIIDLVQGKMKSRDSGVDSTKKV